MEGSVCRFYSQSWGAYSAWRRLADLWMVGRAAGVGVGKGAEGRLRALAARTYPGWLQVGIGRGCSHLPRSPPHLHLGDSHPHLPDLVSRRFSPVLLTS